MKEYPLFTVVLNYEHNGISHLETSFSKILDCNTAFAKSIGYTREELRVKRPNWQTTWNTFAPGDVI